MRCSLVLLAALVQQASANTPSNGKQGAQVQFLAAPTKETTDKSDAEVLPSRGLQPVTADSYGAVAQPAPTKLPWQKIAGPIAAGVIGTGALAGVIAVSVLKNKETTTLPPPPPPPPKLNAKRASFKQAAAAPPPTTDATQFASSGLTEKTTLAIACSLVLVGVCIAVGVCVMCLCNRKKKTRSVAPRSKAVDLAEDEQPMMGTRMDEAKQKWESELNASQYMQVDALAPAAVVPALTPSYSYTGGLGSMPTMQNVVPMQTMPPPPPPPMQFTAPTANYGVQQSYQQPRFQQASPLANTTSALPTTAFSVAPPRFA